MNLGVKDYEKNYYEYPISYVLRDSECYSPNGDKTLNPMKKCLKLDTYNKEYKYIDECALDIYNENFDKFCTYASQDSLISLIYTAKIWGVNKSMPVSITSASATYLYDKILEYTMENGINIGNIYVVKPKVKIIDEDSKTRPIAVSINNNHDAYPHAGLQDAYLAYELIAEGGITRIIAFFKDQTTKKIGSVRSARHYFLDYVLENDAIFVHYGHSPQALSDIKSLKINNINGMYDAKGFFRDTSLHRAYEHTAFTSMDRINKLIKSKKYRNTTEEQLLKYSPIKMEYKTENKKEAKIVEIVYSSYQTTKYVYDPENMNYKMFMGGKEHTDLITKKQYTCYIRCIFII